MNYAEERAAWYLRVRPTLLGLGENRLRECVRRLGLVSEDRVDAVPLQLHGNPVVAVDKDGQSGKCSLLTMVCSSTSRGNLASRRLRTDDS